MIVIQTMQTLQLSWRLGPPVIVWHLKVRDVPQHLVIYKTRSVWMVQDQDTVEPKMDHFKTVMNYYMAIQRAFVTTSETWHLLIDYFLDVRSQTGSSATTWEQFSYGFYKKKNLFPFMYAMTPLVDPKLDALSSGWHQNGLGTGQLSYINFNTM